MSTNEQVARLIANWIINEVFALLNESKTKIEDCKLTPEQLAAILIQLERGQITRNEAKRMTREIFYGNASHRDKHP